VHLMDELFRQYDQLCHNYAVQKIETVGMTYMAATGITAWEDEFDNSYTRKNSVERLLRMSIAMMEKSKGIMYGKNKDKRLSIKIGIHTGKVVIGVIGYHKPQFSLIGDTVNTTSRHCSTAKEGEIILSEEAVKKLKYKLNLFDKKKAEMKGLGIVDVFRWKTNEMELGKDEEKNKRFRKAVKAVIDQLKSENKIVYKTIKERLNPALAFEGRSCRAKRS
jgi:class 3 adenylate cyclase